MTSGELGPRIERYLLGRLPPRERDRFETLLFEDDAVWPLVEDAEEELIDRYLAGQLSPVDHAAFERHFAAPPLRQERIAFRRALPRALAGPGAKRPARSVWARPAWVGLAAALVVAAVWLGTRPGIETGAGVEQPASLSPASRGTAPSASPGPALVLRPGLLRGGGAIPRLEAPAGASVALDLEPGFRSSVTDFAIVLRTVEGAETWKGSGRRSADGPLVRVVIPPDVLRPGDYTLSLTPAASPSPVSEYPLRVTARP